MAYLINCTDGRNTAQIETIQYDEVQQRVMSLAAKNDTASRYSTVN